MWRGIAPLALVLSLAISSAARADVVPVVSNAASGTTTAQFSLTVPAGNDRLLAVGVSTLDTVVVSSVTYGAQVLTRQQGIGQDLAKAEIWTLNAPNVGTANVTVTVSGAAPVIAGATSFTGVDQTLPIIAGATGAANLSSNSASLVLNNTTAQDGMFGTIAIANAANTTNLRAQTGIDTVVPNVRWASAQGIVRGGGSTRTGNTGQNMALNAGIGWLWNNINPGQLNPYAQALIALRKAAAATAPLVVSPSSANITATSATLGGNMTSTGGATISQRGVVYCTCANPLPGGAGVTQLNAGPSDTTGPFTVNATGLTPSTIYAFRAFARNAVGTMLTVTATFTTSAPPNQAPVASAGGPYSASEGSGVTLNGGGSSDPDGNPLTYSWDVNGDTTYGDATGVSPTLTSAQLLALGIGDGPATFSVRVRVSDAILTTTSSATTLTLANTAPTATLGNTGALAEGGTAQVSFSGATDASAADVAAGLRYAYDFDNDGTYDTGGTTYNTATTAANVSVPAAILADGPKTVTVRATVFDKNNGATTYQTSFNVTNLAPTGTLANSVVDEAGTASIALTNVNDVTADRNSLRYAYDFNADGTYDVGSTVYASASTATSANLPAALTADGPASRPVRVAVVDKDGGFSVYSATVTVRNVEPNATLNAPAEIDEGAVAGISFSGVTDVSAADAAAGTKYAYDSDRDGTWDLGALDYATASPLAAVSLPAILTAEGPVDRDIRTAVIDKDGGAHVYDATIKVRNVAPTATLGDVTTEEGTPATVAFTGAADVSAADQAAGFTFEWDVDGDGTFTPGTGSVPVPAPDGPAIRTVKGAILDRDGGRREYSATVTVTNLAPTATIAGPDAVPSSGAVTLTVRTADAGNDTLTSELDWGDGTTETLTGDGEKTVTHTYATPGAKAITLTATDSDGAKSAAARHELTVAAAAAAPAPTTTPAPVAAKQTITGVRVTPRCLRADNLRARVSRTMAVRFSLGTAAPVKFSLQRWSGKRGASKCPPARGKVKPGGRRVPGVYSPFSNRNAAARAGANTVTLAATGRSGKLLRPGTYLLTIESGGVTARTKLWVLAG